jgi:hypothetical protein
MNPEGRPNGPDTVEQELKIIFPSRERKVVKEGVKSLYDYLHKLPEVKYPKAVIFPDASARPLSWAARPVIEAASQERGRCSPPSFYLKHDYSLTEDGFSRWLGQKGYKLTKKNRGNLEDKYFEDYVNTRDTQAQARIGEIVMTARLEPGDSVLVVDDYARNPSPDPSRTRVRGLFGQRGITDVRYFVFMTNKYGTQDSETEYLATALDPDPEARKSGWWSEGFGWKRVKEKTTVALGIKKEADGSKYVVKAGLEKLTTSLRRELRRIGNEVAEEITRVPR